MVMERSVDEFIHKGIRGGSPFRYFSHSLSDSNLSFSFSPFSPPPVFPPIFGNKGKGKCRDFADEGARAGAGAGAWTFLRSPPSKAIIAKGAFG